MRYALRTLGRTPGFTLAATLALALGIGATTAIFTVAHAVLIAPLPFHDPGSLVWIRGVSPRSLHGNASQTGTLFAADFAEFRRSASLASAGGFFHGSWNLTGIGEPRRLWGARVSAGFFETLGARPAMGRAFVDEEYNGRERAVIFSYGLWQSSFGGDPAIVGRKVLLDGAPYEVVGIMPAGFEFPKEVEMWAPLTLSNPLVIHRRVPLFQAFARLRPGATIESAKQELTAIASRLASEFPASNAGWGVEIVTFADHAARPVRGSILLFALGVALVLAIACANAASLMLARAATREREFAVRSALGAGRGRLIRQMLTESGVLALLGGCAGVPLAIGAVKLLPMLDRVSLARAAEVDVTFTVLVVAAVLSLAAGFTAGILPAIQSGRIDLRSALKDGGRGASSGLRRLRYRSALVITEVAMGMTLLVSAGLLARSLGRMLDVHPGFDPQGVLTAQLALTNEKYNDRTKRLDFYERLLDRLTALPVVESAGSVNMIPFSALDNSAGFWLDAESLDRSMQLVAHNRVVMPGYFGTLRVPLIAGRLFTPHDRADSPNVVIVNDVFAGRHVGGSNPLGRRITVDVNPPWSGEIVGVVGSFRQRSLDQEPRAEFFTPLARTPIQGQTLLIRARGSPEALAGVVRREIAAIDPDIPAYNLRTLEQAIEGSLVQPKSRTFLVGGFSIAALLLASIGVYGVISSAAAERTHEIGIRVAVGAQRVDVVRLVVRDALALTGVGLALGIAGAAAAGHLLRGFLYGVRSTDLLTFGAASMVFLMVAIAASWLPARRALKVDPISALRDE